jgi:hypothetical protein
MNVGQQPPSSGYVPAQQQCTFTNHIKYNGGGQGNGRGFTQQPTMNYGGTGSGQKQNIHPPNPYKRWENWNYCHSHGGDVDYNHTSAMCGKPGPMNNPNTSCTNIMGRSVTKLHKTIFSLASGWTPPTVGAAWQQSTPPAPYGGMPPANSTYRQQMTMVMPVYQPGQGMMMNIGQYPQGAKNVTMMQMGQQPTVAPMLMNHYAPN